MAIINAIVKNVLIDVVAKGMMITIHDDDYDQHRRYSSRSLSVNVIQVITSNSKQQP